MSIGETAANGVNHTLSGTESGEENISEVLANAKTSDTREGFIAPLPWAAKAGYVFAGKNCIAICDTDNASPKRYAANAAFIVRAVNSHDDLLAALKALKRAVATEVIIHGAGCTGEYLKAEDQASAAILKAESQS